MSAHSLRINNKTLYLQKAVIAPAFGHPTILVEDNWDFVEMWLKKQKKLRDALFFWSQAQSFHQATAVLPKTAAPLAAYYAALNATKALLLAKREAFSPSHGLSGKNTGDKTSLSNENISVKGAGVLPSLCKYLGEALPAAPVNLKQILYNLPFVHRAFCTTYATAKDLFIPIQEPHFVRKEKSDEAWFCCTVADRKPKSAKIFSSFRPMSRTKGSPTDSLYAENSVFAGSTSQGIAVRILRT